MKVSVIPQITDPDAFLQGRQRVLTMYSLMIDLNEELVKEAREYVTLILTHELSDNCLFHTLNHTLEVVRNAEIIGSYCHLDDHELNILGLAALFHDTGYLDAYDDHEFFSAERARRFLLSRQVDGNVIEQIERAILSTKTPQKPEDRISEILCDADLMNLTFDDYFEQVDLMRMEWEKVGRAKLDPNQFYLNTLEFFQSHTYHSRYGKEILQPRKELTEQRIRERVSVGK
jgi:uncharacterized protein